LPIASKLRARTYAAAIAPPVHAADFDWKRYDGIQVRFMVSTHPCTEWAQKQLASLEAATGIKVVKTPGLVGPTPDDGMSTRHESVCAILELGKPSAGEGQMSTDEPTLVSDEPIEEAQPGRYSTIGLMVDWHPP
jgi:hypothetical protein